MRWNRIVKMISQFYGLKGSGRFFTIFFSLLIPSFVICIWLGSIASEIWPEWSTLIIGGLLCSLSIAAVMCPLISARIRIRKISQKRPKARIYRHVVQTADTLDGILRAGGRSPRNQQLSLLCVAVYDKTLVFVSDWGQEILRLRADDISEIRIESIEPIVPAAAAVWPAVVLEIARANETVSIPFYVAEPYRVMSFPTWKELAVIV
jgi:hypothetical protein